MIVLSSVASLAIALTAPQTGPGVLCYVPWKYSCCIQHLNQWKIFCNGVACVGDHTANGPYIGSVQADPGQAGHTLIRTYLKPNGHSCKFEVVFCDPVTLECVHTGDYVSADCHDEEKYGAECSG